MFSVEAMSNDGHRSSIAHVILNIEDINDHTPEFKKSVSYFKNILYDL